MKVIHLSPSTPSVTNPTVLAIGNFDAVHKGHQALLNTAHTIANTLKLPLGVLTFEPHPRRLFRANDPPFRVTPLPIKLERLKLCGVEKTFICPFNWDLANLSADEFIQKILRDQCQATSIVIGDDFHFGHNRQGTIEDLKKSGFQVTAVTQSKDSNHSIYSATRIRGLIQAGKIEDANALLGWQWEIQGEVIHGNKNGRTLGYPTANIALDETIHPSYGVYAAQVKIKDMWQPAALNIGIRPMFEVKTALLEAHILDFQGDLYGQTLSVRPLQKIRDEAKFNSLDELKTQMAKDCDEARKIILSRA